MESEVLLSSTITERDYPPPPRVHWLVLLLGFWVSSFIVAFLVPTPYVQLADSLVGDAWVFYLCLWLRQLEPESKCMFWGDAGIVINLAFAAISVSQYPTPALHFAKVILGIASIVLGLITIYSIRAELTKHYNEKEQYGLLLSGVMTYFFSFVYFQYHLYDIAQSKHKEAKERALSMGRTYIE
jgi:hypothetical protein